MKLSHLSASAVLSLAVAVSCSRRKGCSEWEREILYIQDDTAGAVSSAMKSNCFDPPLNGIRNNNPSRYQLIDDTSSVRDICREIVREPSNYGGVKQICCTGPEGAVPLDFSSCLYTRECANIIYESSDRIPITRTVFINGHQVEKVSCWLPKPICKNKN